MTSPTVEVPDRPELRLPGAIRAARGALSGKDAEPVSQAELARRAHITTSRMSLVVEGQRAQPDFIEALLQLPDLPLVNRYGVLVAHLHDEAVRAGGDLSHLDIRFVDGVSLSATELSAQTNTAIGIIAREAELHPYVADLVDNLATLIVRSRAAEADLVTYPSAQDEPDELRRIVAEEDARRAGESDSPNRERHNA